jgi:hypothetical protein
MPPKAVFLVIGEVGRSPSPPLRTATIQLGRRAPSHDWGDAEELGSGQRIALHGGEEVACQPIQARHPGGDDRLACESAWNKDPVFGVIGIQSFGCRSGVPVPCRLTLHSFFRVSGPFGWVAVRRFRTTWHSAQSLTIASSFGTNIGGPRSTMALRSCTGPPKATPAAAAKKEIDKAYAKAEMTQEPALPTGAADAPNSLMGVIRFGA